MRSKQIKKDHGIPSYMDRVQKRKSSIPGYVSGHGYDRFKDKKFECKCEQNFHQLILWNIMSSLIVYCSCIAAV